MSHDRFDTVWASSTHTMSTDSNDLMLSAVWSDKPLNRNSVPFAPRISVWVTV